MGKPTGFMESPRRSPPRRSVEERLRDFREVETKHALPVLKEQAGRCMDCGIPFCHNGCPLGNPIPDFNDLVHRGNLGDALARLEATNNFPELTGAICPAPCEDACVLEMSGEPVTIKAIEKSIGAVATFAPKLPRRETGKSVGIVGSGPAGLAAAQQLRRAGHAVTVYERDDRLGGLLRYGIPDFKLEKAVLDRRLEQLRFEGVRFRTGADVGSNVTGSELWRSHEAIVIAVGALGARTMRVPGADLPGVVMAMDYLTEQNRVVAGDRAAPAIDARDKRVVILGGGDTGADCLGTALRQGAREVLHYHYKPEPPRERTEEMPWPTIPLLLRESSSHEEGGTRGFNLAAKAFEGDGRLERLRLSEVDWQEVDGRLVMREVGERVVGVDLALVAIGFTGPTPNRLYADLGIGTRDAIATRDGYTTNARGVFVCGDARRGASLVVWAIYEGRETAREVDAYLMGESHLPTTPRALSW
jgi:glutamate synthase (NADPH/NADH) small chain